MIEGTYTFKQNGRVLCESKNLITNAGRTAITRYFAGYIARLTDSISVGVSSATPNVTDVRLGHEINRFTVTSVGADIDNQRIVYKTILPEEVAGEIWEAGAVGPVIMQNNIYGSQTLTTFDSNPAITWSAGTAQTTGRHGGNTLRLNAAVSASLTASITNFGKELSGYSDDDEFNLAFVSAANVASLEVRIGMDSSNYWKITLTGISAGYTIKTWTKGSMTKVGSPNWSSVNFLSFILTSNSTGASSIDLDSFRIEDTDRTDFDAVLISHSTLTTPVTKVAGTEMEIEYSLRINV